LVLVTGPTGSGKSTTLAGMIDYINQTEAAHIITIEDPIEFVHPDKKSIINQREVGSDTLSFSAALKRALRQDPDVILIGEMRDLETIGAAITAAETGHLVFGTCNTTSAPPDHRPRHRRLPPRGPGPGAQPAGVTLQGVLSQNLVAKSRRWPRPGLGSDGGQPGHPQSNPRRQDLPDPQRHAVGRQRGQPDP